MDSSGTPCSTASLRTSGVTYGDSPDGSCVGSGYVSEGSSSAADAAGSDAAGAGGAYAGGAGGS